MEQSKSCITINCGGCNTKNSMPFEVEIVFDEIASQVGDFNLLKPITDYRILCVEYGSLQQGEKDWTRSFEWIMYPTVTNSKEIYRGMRILGWETYQVNCLMWHFSNENTLTIDNIKTYMLKLGVTKIYGIR